MLRQIAIVLIFTLSASNAWAYACVSAQSGLWTDAATWTDCNSTYPQVGDTATITSRSTTGDRVVISGTVTQPATTVGTVSAGNTAFLVYSSNAHVTATGDLSLATASNVNSNVTLQAGAFLNMSSSSVRMNPATFTTGTYNLTSAGTAVSPVTIFGTTGSWVSYPAYTTGSYNKGTVSLAYTNIVGFDDGANTNGIHAYDGLTFDHVYFDGVTAPMASWNWGGSTQVSGAVMDIRNCDVRGLVTYRAGRKIYTGATIYVASSGASPTTRQIKDCSFAGDYDSPTVPSLIFGAFTTITGTTLLNWKAVGYNSFSSTITDSAGYWEDAPYALGETVILTQGDGFENNLLTSTSDNWHGVIIQYTAGKTPSMITDNVFDGENVGADNLVISGAGGAEITTNLFIGGGAALSQLGTSGTEDILFKQNTIVLDNGTSGDYGFGLLTETGYNPQHSSLKMSSNIFAGTGTTTATAVFQQNSNMRRLYYSDYNSFYNLGGGTFTDYRSADSPYIFDIPAMSTPVFTGSGLDDLSVYRTYLGSGTTSFQVKITANGTPDKWQFSKDGGATWNGVDQNCATSYASVDTAATYLTVKFGATTGHTVGDVWAFDGSLLTKDTSEGWAAHDILSTNYAFLDRTRETATYNGKTSRTEVFNELVKLNGRDRYGSAATYDNTYMTSKILSWIRKGFTPTTAALKGAGEGGVDIGAVAVTTGNAIWFGM